MEGWRRSRKNADEIQGGTNRVLSGFQHRILDITQNLATAHDFGLLIATPTDYVKIQEERLGYLVDPAFFASFDFALLRGTAAWQGGSPSPNT